MGWFRKTEGKLSGEDCFAQGVEEQVRVNSLKVEAHFGN